MLGRTQQLLTNLASYFYQKKILQQEFINNDVYRLLSELNTYAKEIEEAFARMYLENRFWNHHNSIIFLKNLLAELAKKKQQLEDKIIEIKRAEDSYERVIVLKWLDEGIQLIDHTIEDVKVTLCERSLALNSNELTLTSAGKLRDNPAMFRPTDTYMDALFVFSDSDLPTSKHLPVSALPVVLEKFGCAGLQQKAGRKLCQLVWIQVMDRLQKKEINISNPVIMQSLEFISKHHPDLNHDMQVNLYSHRLSRVNAFNKIYQALCDQSGTPFLLMLERMGKLPISVDAIELITADCLRNPQGAVAKAWQLAEQHHDNCNIENRELFFQVYKHVWSKKFFALSNITGVTFFRRASFDEQVHELTSEQIRAAGQRVNTRGWRIYQRLAN